MKDKEIEKYRDSIVSEDATGEKDWRKDFKLLVYPIDKYEITVEVDQDDKFIGIKEVKINKNFLSYKQKIASQGYHDVEDFYKEK